MRPVRLEIEGFSGFRAPAVVDFGDADLVAFVGPTGSGKSSIIDAITFALYGSVARYDDRRVVEPVIHQLAQEAKVRLDFEVGGHPHTAVRVVRRKPSGGATTKEARLVRHDTVGSETILAGAEREMGPAVVDLLGVTFEQFTKTCVLPQGDFAAFLHADKSTRQALLRQLLDVGVYERMGQLARRRAEQASAKAELLREQLEADPPMDDDELAALEARAAALAALVDEVPALVGALRAVDDELRALAERREAAAALAKRLDEVAVPPAVGELDEQLAGAQRAVDEATRALADARARRDSAKQARDEGPDAAALRQVLRAAEQLQGRAAELADVEAEAEQAHAREAEAARDVEVAGEARAAAERVLRAARDAAGLEGVIAGLVAGEPCPVCRQVVDELPDHDVAAELAEAEAAFEQAAARAQAASDAHRRLAEAAAALDAKRQVLATSCDELRAQVPAGTDLDATRDQIARADQLAHAYDAALEAVTDAERREQRAIEARAALEADEARHRAALAEVRNELAELRPPAPTGASLAADWQVLADWAAAERDRVAAELDELGQRAGDLAVRRDDASLAVQERCRPLGIEVGDPDRLAEVVAATKARTDERLAQARDRRARAAEVDAQIQALGERAQVHGTLGGLLKADRFERWLLQAALDRLVARATDRLVELSGGRFSLVSDDGDFLIRDHGNADELRSVRTLSGGETFLTSLALAHALAEDIAELATDGAPRLESMFLDEGFGTLDPDTLDVVATAIEELGASGRLIGIVTHIRDLADRMPVRFEVQRDTATSRVERVVV